MINLPNAGLQQSHVNLSIINSLTDCYFLYYTAQLHGSMQNLTFSDKLQRQFVDHIAIMLIILDANLYN
jgi:hypothetical protein